jgi:cytochrome c peroxidase
LKKFSSSTFLDQSPVSITSPTSALGKVLFRDPRFSADGQVSCATCHLAPFAFADTVALSTGVWGRQATRNTPALAGLPDSIPLMWDGGVTAICYGSHGVLAAATAHHDQDMNPIELERKLSYFPHYRAALHGLYPQHSLASGYLLAIRDYVKDIALSSNLRGRLGHGSESGKDTVQRQSIANGRSLFTGKAGCNRCHHGPSLTDGKFYNLNLDSLDPGRAAITLQEADRGRFRTPSLRMLGRTAPFFHNGSAATLRNVLQHYINGAGEAGQLRLSPSEQADLLAYLETL